MIFINTLVKVILQEEVDLDLDRNKIGNNVVRAYVEYSNIRIQFKQRYVDDIEKFKELVSEDNFVDTLQTKLKEDERISMIMDCLDWCDNKYIVCGEIREATRKEITLENLKQAMLDDLDTGLMRFIHSERISKDTLRMVFYDHLHQAYQIEDISVDGEDVYIEGTSLCSIAFDKACKKNNADIGLLFKEDLSMAFEFDEDNDGEAIFTNDIDVDELIKRYL